MRLDTVYFVENNKKIYFSYCSLMNLLFIGLITLFMSMNSAPGAGPKKKKRAETQNVQTWM